MAEAPIKIVLCRSGLDYCLRKFQFEKLLKLRSQHNVASPVWELDDFKLNGYTTCVDRRDPFLVNLVETTKTELYVAQVPMEYFQGGFWKIEKTPSRENLILLHEEYKVFKHTEFAKYKTNEYVQTLIKEIDALKENNLRLQSHNMKLKTELIRSTDKITSLENDNATLTYIANTSAQHTDETLSACEELLRINANLIKLHTSYYNHEVILDSVYNSNPKNPLTQSLPNAFLKSDDALLKSAESSEDTN